MSLSRFVESLGMIGVAIALTGVVQAETRTYVSLAGRDDAIAKLGTPGIAVRVDAGTPLAVAPLTGELAREFGRQVHTRPLAGDETGDYDLLVTVDAPRVSGRETTVPFAAVLKSAKGERLWGIEGRADLVDASPDASVFAGIGRNVVSALIHDGWVLPRYDPENPPPQPPAVRND